MICKNIKELEKVVNVKISKSLKNNVAGKVKENMSEHILKDVYNKWSPSRYTRRGGDAGFGGLGDPENFFDTVDSNVLIIANIAKTNSYLNGLDTSLKFPYNSFTQRGYSRHMDNDWLSPIIEYGIGYDYQNVPPRPFIHNTYEDLLNYGIVVNALKEGLKQQGINII